MTFDPLGYHHPPYQLTARETRWLEQARHNAELVAADNDRRRLVGPGRKLNSAVERWKTATSHMAQALANASVSSPPQPPRAAGRRGSDVSDPTLAQIEATWHAVDNACVTWAHLIGPCTIDRCRPCDRDNDTLTSLFDRLGIDLQPAAVIDALLGTPPSSRHAFNDVLHLTDKSCSMWADELRDIWHDLRRGGLEDDVLTQVADRAGFLAGRAHGLVGAITQWLPDTTVRRCANGCGGAAPEVGKGATCQRCRDARRVRSAS